MLQTITHVLILILDIAFAYCLIKAIKLIGEETESDFYQSPSIFIKVGYGSLITSWILLFFLEFKGQIPSIILTLISLVAFALIALIRSSLETRIEQALEKQEREEKVIFTQEITTISHEYTEFGLLSLMVAILAQLASIIIHIIGIYIPGIRDLILWIF